MPRPGQIRPQTRRRTIPIPALAGRGHLPIVATPIQADGISGWHVSRTLGKHEDVPRASSGWHVSSAGFAALGRVPFNREAVVVSSGRSQRSCTSRPTRHHCCSTSMDRAPLARIHRACPRLQSFPLQTPHTSDKVRHMFRPLRTPLPKRPACLRRAHAAIDSNGRRDGYCESVWVEPGAGERVRP